MRVRSRLGTRGQRQIGHSRSWEDGCWMECNLDGAARSSRTAWAGERRRMPG